MKTMHQIEATAIASQYLTLAGRPRSNRHADYHMEKLLRQFSEFSAKQDKHEAEKQMIDLTQGRAEWSPGAGFRNVEVAN